MPYRVFEDFLEAALPNTEQDIETCGTLCGNQVSLVQRSSYSSWVHMKPPGYNQSNV